MDFLKEMFFMLCVIDKNTFALYNIVEGSNDLGEQAP